MVRFDNSIGRVLRFWAKIWLGPSDSQIRFYHVGVCIIGLHKKTDQFRLPESKKYRIVRFHPYLFGNSRPKFDTEANQPFQQDNIIITPPSADDPHILLEHLAAPFTSELTTAILQLVTYRERVLDGDETSALEDIKDDDCRWGDSRRVTPPCCSTTWAPWSTSPVGQSNQYPWWTQKPIYTPIFTHHIRSWLLSTLVILHTRAYSIPGGHML